LDFKSKRFIIFSDVCKYASNNLFKVFLINILININVFDISFNSEFFGKSFEKLNWCFFEQLQVL